MATINDLTTPLRHERDRGRITGKLRDVAEARLDVVAPFGKTVWNATSVALTVDEPILHASGVFSQIGATYNRHVLGQLCGMLDIPIKYVDRLTADEDWQRKRLVTTNLNVLAQTDTRTPLLRFLRGDDGWALSALLSNSYNAIDNLDGIMAMIAGMQASGHSLDDCEVEADWRDGKMHLRVVVPAIELAVPDLLAGYRWPFSHRRDRGVHDPAEEGEIPPVLWAGLDFNNSETGGGAFTVAPVAFVQICRNGLTQTIEMVRKVHLGSKLDEGAVNWSADTRRKNLELVSAQVADSVRDWLSVEYLEKVANRMRVAKGIPVADVAKAMVVVQQRLGFTEAETTSVLDAFVRGGDLTVLGIGQAVTAAAQLADDSDRQTEMESCVWQVLDSPHVFAAA